MLLLRRCLPIPIFIFIFAHPLIHVNAATYEFLLDNDEIFDNCPHIPDNNGFHDIFDIKNLNIEYNEGRATISGNVTCQWDGVEASDRIKGKGELLKFQRGAWQPTPISTTTFDFCADEFKPNSIWYDMWTKHINEKDRLCLNNYGLVYRMNKFSLNSAIDFAGNMEGRYKVFVHLEAFDSSNRKRPKEICYQIFGEFVKVK
ncbi:uncharacterized protein [Musca autumnalis]|uniref:uncharacterized protein n=1 Tax=Musca autumnalis TaxID=221902 RepID=UPI003CE79101